MRPMQPLNRRELCELVQRALDCRMSADTIVRVLDANGAPCVPQVLTEAMRLAYCRTPPGDPDALWRALLGASPFAEGAI